MTFRVVEPDDEIRYVKFVGGPLDGLSLESRAGDVPPTVVVKTESKHAVSTPGAEETILEMESDSSSTYTYHADHEAYVDAKAVAEAARRMTSAALPAPSAPAGNHNLVNPDAVRVRQSGGGGRPILLDDGDGVTEIYKPSQTDTDAIVKDIEVPGVSPDMSFADAMGRGRL